MTIPNSLGDYKVVSDKVKDVLSRRIDVVNPFLDASRSDASGLNLSGAYSHPVEKRCPGATTRFISKFWRLLSIKQRSR